jgi:uncharacterized protein (DUF1697 family)
LIWLNQEQQFEEFIKDTPLLEEKKLLFRLINEKPVEVPEEIVSRWTASESNETILVPYDLYILSNSKHKALAFSRLKEMIDRRRGQIINYRQEPFLKPLRGIAGFWIYTIPTFAFRILHPPWKRKKNQPQLF